MLKNKKHGDVMQPYEHREGRTVSFLKAINPTLTYEVQGSSRLDVQVSPRFGQALQINDPYGPTLTGPTFNAIIVSEETEKVSVSQGGFPASYSRPPGRQ